MIDTDDSWPSDIDPTARKAAVDALVGSRLRLCRDLLGWTLEDTANALGRDAALLCEYEAGRARISPADLTEIARIFQIPIIWFFVGLTSLDGDKENEASRSTMLSANEEKVAGEHLTLLTKEMSKIKDPSTRIMLIDMARSLAHHFK